MTGWKEGKNTKNLSEVFQLFDHKSRPFSPSRPLQVVSRSSLRSRTALTFTPPRHLASNPPTSNSFSFMSHLVPTCSSPDFALQIDILSTISALSEASFQHSASFAPFSQRQNSLTPLDSFLPYSSSSTSNPLMIRSIVLLSLLQSLSQTSESRPAPDERL